MYKKIHTIEYCDYSAQKEIFALTRAHCMKYIYTDMHRADTDTY